MPLYQIDKVQTPYRAKFGIVNEIEVAGARSVNSISDLYEIPDPILSIDAESAGNDAIGQEWYVTNESKKYRLIDWEKRNTSAGWVMSDPIDLINNITIKNLGNDKYSVELPENSQSSADNAVQTKVQINALINTALEGFIPGSTSNSIYTENNSALTPVNNVITWNVNHGIGTKNVFVHVENISTKKLVECDITINSESSITINIDSTDVIAADTYCVRILGVNVIESSDEAVAVSASYSSEDSTTSSNNIWTGTQQEYDAISEKNSNTIYFII